MQTMIVKAIVKAYFLGAIAVSFAHIIAASHKLALNGWQAWTTPFAIDGIAIIGMVMRSERWSDETNRLGFRVQVTAGLLSLACNVFAGNTLGERIYGVIIVGLFIFSEWLGGKLVTRASVEAEAKAAAEAAEAARVAAEAEAKKAAAVAKGKATRAANRAAQEKIVKAGRRRMEKELESLVG